MIIYVADIKMYTSIYTQRLSKKLQYCVLHDYWPAKCTVTFTAEGFGEFSLYIHPCAGHILYHRHSHLCVYANLVPLSMKSALHPASLFLLLYFCIAVLVSSAFTSLLLLLYLLPFAPVSLLPYHPHPFLHCHFYNLQQRALYNKHQRTWDNIDLWGWVVTWNYKGVDTTGVIYRKGREEGVCASVHVAFNSKGTRWQWKWIC